MEEHGLRRKLAATIVALLAFLVFMTIGVLAVFTDQATVTANAFTAGTIDIGVNPTSALVSLTGMMPGDSVTDDLVVTNQPGSGALRYAISSTATDPDSKALKDQLALVIKTIDATAPATPCDDFDGTQLYSGDLDSTTGKLVGDSSQGSQAGDRSLGTGASETLCFRVSLPLSTGDAFQSASTTATFTFDAEQTANNP